MSTNLPNPGSYQKLKIKLTDGSEHEFVLVPGAKGEDGNSGLAIRIKGVVDTTEDLPDVADYEIGDGWMVEDELWALLDNGQDDWTSLGSLKGAKGDPGVGIILVGWLPTETDLPSATDFEAGEAWIIQDTGFVYVSTPNTGSEEGEPEAVWTRVLLGQQGEQGEQGDPGTPGSDLNIDGAAETVEQLIADYPIGTAYGDGHIIGDGSTFLVESHAYVMTNEAWVDAGIVLQGPGGEQGPQGEKGDQGDELKINGAAASEAELNTVYPAGTELADGHTIGDGSMFLVDTTLYVMTNRKWVKGGQIKGKEGKEGPRGPIGVIGPRGYTGIRGLRGPAGTVHADGACATIEDLPELPNDGYPEGYTMLVPNLETGLAHAFVVTDDEWQDGGAIEGKQGTKGDKGDKGEEGTPCIPIKVLGTLKGEVNVDPLTILPAIDTVEEGQGYFINQPYEDSVQFQNELILWARTEKLVDGQPVWTSFGDFRGSRGIQGVPGVEGKKGDKGEPGMVNFDHALESVDLLPQLPDDAYPNGYSVLIPDADNIAHAWVSAGDRWVDTGKIQGVPGNTGQTGATGNDGNDGKDGLSAYELWKEYGVEGPEDENGWAAYLEAYQGEQGEQGIQGDIGPGVRILDYLATEAELDAIDTTNLTFGDGYLVGENFFAWILSTSEWRDCGVIRGPQGERGEQGKQGIQGKKGDKGERGAYWLIFDREPLNTDGRDYDCFLNINTMSAYLKTNDKWVYQGKMGGGNVYKTNADGIIYVMQDGEWITLPVGEAPMAEDNPDLADVPHVRRNGEWVRFDQYALPIFDTNGELDLAKGNCFNLVHPTNVTISIKNAPAKCVKVCTLYIDYDAGIVTWPDNIVWSHGESPVLPSVEGAWILITMYVNEDKIFVNTGMTN
jgi:hypothetical protein